MSRDDTRETSQRVSARLRPTILKLPHPANFITDSPRLRNAITRKQVFFFFFFFTRVPSDIINTNTPILLR